MSSQEYEIKILRNDNQIKMGKRTYIWLGITKNDPELMKEIIEKEPAGKKINLHIVISKIADINEYLFESLIYMHTVNNNIRLEIHFPIWNNDLFYLFAYKVDEYFIGAGIKEFNGYITLDDGFDFTVSGSMGNKLKVRYNENSVHALIDTVYSSSDNKNDPQVDNDLDLKSKLEDPNVSKDEIIGTFPGYRSKFIDMFKDDKEYFDYMKRFYGRR